MIMGIFSNMFKPNERQIEEAHKEVIDISKDAAKIFSDVADAQKKKNVDLTSLEKAKNFLSSKEHILKRAVNVLKKSKGITDSRLVEMKKELGRIKNWADLLERVTSRLQIYAKGFVSPEVRVAGEIKELLKDV
jgi:hypothetical protein